MERHEGLIERFDLRRSVDCPPVKSAPSSLEVGGGKRKLTSRNTENVLLSLSEIVEGSESGRISVGLEVTDGSDLLITRNEMKILLDHDESALVLVRSGE